MERDIRNTVMAWAFVLLLISTSTAIVFYPTDEPVSSVDYSDEDNWLAIPSSNEFQADVFYLYPTTWQRNGSEQDVFCQIDDPVMREGANALFNVQATAFATVANVYAPFYRGADPAYALSLAQEDKDRLIGSIPASDATAAFEYYLENFNQGRPFILAGHSQGSNVLLFMLSDFMSSHPDIYARMIAAYVIGYSVTSEYMDDNPHLRFAEGSNDTGVIISYNTEAAGYDGVNPVLLPGSLVINPISWTRDEAMAPASDNLGSIVVNSTRDIVSWREMNYADACVNLSRGVLHCSTVNASSLPSTNFPPGVYHSFDYMFYYYDLRENAALRISTYLAS